MKDELAYFFLGAFLMWCYWHSSGINTKTNYILTCPRDSHEWRVQRRLET